MRSVGVAAMCTALLLAPAPSAAQAPTEEELDAFHARAMKLLDDRNYDSKRSEHYIIRTDDPRVDVVEISKLLERFWTFFQDVFSPLGELRAQDKPVEVILLYSRYKYDRLHEDMQGIGSAGVAGHYREDLDVLAAHTDSVPPGDLPGLLTHEAAHHLVSRRILGPKSARASRWLHEGLGSYFGFTRMDRRGVFHAGELGGQEAEILRGAPRERAVTPRAPLNAFKRLMKEAEPGFVDDLVREEMQSAFMIEETGAKYIAAWLLVHYLLHGENGSLAGPFREYMSLEAAGKGGAEALYRTLGASPEELEAGFIAHVKKLKSR